MAELPHPLPDIEGRTIHRNLLPDEERQRILLVTTGSRGDVQPYIGFSNRLIELGHEVFFATHHTFEAFLGKHAHPETVFVPLLGNPGEILQKEEFLEAFYDGNLRKQLDVMKKEMEESNPGNMEIVVQASLKFKITSLLTGIVNIVESLVVGHLLMLPVVVAATVPFFPSGEFSPIGIPGRVKIGFINKGLHKLGQYISWKMLTKKHCDNIRIKYNLPLLPNLDQAATPQICIFSSHVFPRPSDWPNSVTISGYWILPPKEHEILSEDIQEFLNSGDAPIYMGFGSMPIKDKANVLASFEKALESTNQRGIFCGGWNEIDFNPKDPSRLLLIKEAPHELLLSKCKMAIHHGGAGTTAASCRAGVPTLIYSVLIDQPFWAARMGELGVGPVDPIPLKDLNAAHLVKSINFCLQEPVRDKARALSEKLLSEDGVHTGVATFLEYVTKHRNPDPNHRLHLMSEHEAPNCQREGCTASFGFFTRRNNCLCCGGAFCSPHTIIKKVMNYAEPVPVCVNCIHKFKL